MTSTNVILAIDESGAKGYANQVESYPGEIGILAGILVNQGNEGDIRPVFQDIYERYKTETGKLHITDLESGQQETLREEIYASIRELKLPCFWYAIHVQGLHDWYLTERNLIEKSIQARREAGRQTRIKPSNTSYKPLLMHERLFEGLFAHLIAFLEEQGIKEASIEIRTDQIDKSTVKAFRKSAVEFLSDDPYRREHTGWDTMTNQVVKGHIQINTEAPSIPDIGVAVNSLDINTIDGGDGYVVAADVLANSLHNLFKTRNQSERYKPLNEPAAIKMHPLAENLWPFQQQINDDLAGDRLCRHPKSQNE